MYPHKFDLKNDESKRKKTSPNRKYRKARNCKYESNMPNYLAAPEIISITSEPVENNIQDEQKVKQNLISEKLFSILRESPERITKKNWIKKAKKLGINIYEDNGDMKSLDKLLFHCRVMVKYVSETENCNEEEPMFKIKTLDEIADILDIEKRNKTRTELLEEIINVLQ
jgi:hypothetical protein